MITRSGITILLVSWVVIVAALGALSGNGAGAPSLTPTPTPTPTVSPEPVQDAAPSPSPTAGPMVHLAVVAEQFLCETCHSLDSAWVLPEDHAQMQDRTCVSCHAPAPEPSPAAVHLVPGDTATGELCSLCHAEDIVLGARPVAPLLAPRQECSSCHGEGSSGSMPADHDGRSVTTCSLCHQEQTLAAMDVPHKVAGWEQCSFCHLPGRLAPMKGGHKDIADSDCLDCHAATKDPPALAKTMLAHSDAKGGCASCHGDGKLASLPADHAERPQTTCALCHNATGKVVPSAPHSLLRQPACSNCHTPATLATIDGHASRSDHSCTACHAESHEEVPNVPHTLIGRENCTACHTQATPAPARGLAD